MAKKKKKTKHRKPKTLPNRSISDAAPEETRAAEAVTVFWLLTVFSTAVAEFGWCVVRSMAIAFEDRERWLALLTVVFGIAFLSGAATLALTPIAIRVRKTRPPQSIVVSAIIVGCLPATLLGISYCIR